MKHKKRRKQIRSSNIIKKKTGTKKTKDELRENRRRNIILSNTEQTVIETA